MTDADVNMVARKLVLAIEEYTARLGMEPGDRVSMAAIMAAEIAGRVYGPAAAIEFLRNTADICERQIMAEMH